MGSRKAGYIRKAPADTVARWTEGLLGVDGMPRMEGALPVTVGGTVVGAIGISGMTGSQDAQIAQAGIAALAPWSSGCLAVLQR